LPYHVYDDYSVTISAQIVDGTGTTVKTKVTSIGQVVTAPYSYDEVSAGTLDVDNTAVNFFGPKTGQQFVLTVILLTANKNVTTDCTVDIYAAATATATAITKSILNVEMLKNTSRDITGLNLVVAEGLYINGKTDDDDVFVTIMGYYIPKIE